MGFRSGGKKKKNKGPAPSPPVQKVAQDWDEWSAQIEYINTATPNGMPRRRQFRDPYQKSKAKFSFKEKLAPIPEAAATDIAIETEEKLEKGEVIASPQDNGQFVTQVHVSQVEEPVHNDPSKESEQSEHSSNHDEASAQSDNSHHTEDTCTDQTNDAKDTCSDQTNDAEDTSSDQTSAILNQEAKDKGESNHTHNSSSVQNGDIDIKTKDSDSELSKVPNGESIVNMEDVEVEIHPGNSQDASVETGIKKERKLSDTTAGSSDQSSTSPLWGKKKKVKVCIIIIIILVILGILAAGIAVYFGVISMKDDDLKEENVTTVPPDK